MMIQAIVAGGQTGADRAGLEVAKELGIGSGGYAPKGWRTEEGPRPELETFGCIEHSSEDYTARTRDNVLLADATVIFGVRSRGSNRTEEEARLAGKPCHWIQWPLHESLSSKERYYYTPANALKFRLWLKKHNVQILNVAGNRESKNPGIGEFVKSFLIKALR